MKTMKKNGGFTLVELIVVIAILAILAAVAIPAYSGYIEKANRAGDETLLNTLNKAFTSACNLNGTDPSKLSKIPTVDLADADNDGEKTIAGVKNVDANIASSFMETFAGNQDTEFKVIKSIAFNPYTRLFVDGADELLVQFGGNNYGIKMESISGFMNSVFADNVDAMQTQLSGISDAFGTFVGNVEAAGSLSPAFKEYLDKNGVTDAQLGNATVLYVAQNAGNYDAQDVYQMFDSCGNYIKQNPGAPLGNILNNAFSEDDDALTSIALMYGAVTAYANSNKCTDPSFKEQVANIKDGETLLDAFMALEGDQKADWGGYINDDQFTTDMNGFLGAMDALNTVSPDVDKDDTDFWNSDEVNGLLGSLLG